MVVKNKKKVLFTSHTANFSKFNRPFMRWFKSQGYEVHYASAGEEEVLDCDKHFTVSFERSPFKLNNLRAINQLKKIIDTEGYDIIHTHTPMGSVVTRLAAKAARKNGTRVIYTAHGFHFFTGAPILNWLIYYPIEKVMAKYTDTLITINKEDYERAKRKFNTDVQYVPGVGIDPKKFGIKMSANEKLALRKSLGLKKNDFVILYIAELNKNKNQAMLLRALNILKQKGVAVKLLLAGTDSLNGTLQAMVADNEIVDSVQFLGYRNDIPNLIQITDLAITASRREGLPVNVMEAMYAGIPVVATACRGNGDLVENNQNGFIVPQDDENETAIAIEKLTTNKAQRNAFGGASKQMIRPYVMDSVMRKMENVYAIDIKEPIRILHVVTIMNRGGLETMIMNYYRNIDRSKVQFDFLVHNDSEGAYDAEILRLGGKIYRHVPMDLKNLIHYRKKLAHFFAIHKEFKIIHSHIDALSALPLSVAKKAKIPVRIAHSHNNSFDKDSKYLIRIVAKRFIARYATNLFGCSKDAINNMFGSSASDAIVINNAVDTDIFNFNPEKRNKIRVDLDLEGNFVMGHVGRFDPQKNHSFLIDIFNEVYGKNDNARLLLIGDGEGRARAEEKVVNLGLKNAVIFLGIRSDISDLMQAMDVFVMPSHYEGLPVVSIEAQMSGLECFFSDVITKDLSIAERTHFISLNKSSKEWAYHILNISHSKRQKIMPNDQYSGFDITLASKKLEMMYEKFAK